MATHLEVHMEGKEHPFIIVKTVGSVPELGDYININKQTYRVLNRTWAIDRAPHPDLRCNIDVRELI